MPNRRQSTIARCRPFSVLHYFDDQTASDFALQKIMSAADDICERNGPCHSVEPIEVDLAREAIPRLFSIGNRPVDAVDAHERHAAQYEGRDRSRKIHALRETASRHDTVVLHRCAHIGERMAADAVHGTGPARFGKRFARGRQFRTVDNLRRTECAQIIGLLRPAGRSNDAISEPVKNR